MEAKTENDLDCSYEYFRVDYWGDACPHTNIKCLYH